MQVSQRVVQAVVAMLLMAVAMVSAFPSGAPLSACGHLMPIHEEAAAQETAPPFLILLSDTDYTSHQPIKVTVTSGDTYLAFMLQGRTLDNRPVGHFSIAPPVSKFLSCYGDNDTLSHAAAFGRQAMEVTWHPPQEDVGDVFITGSIAKTKYIFWAVESELIKGKPRSGDSGVSRQTPSSPLTVIVTLSVLIRGQLFFNRVF